MTPETPRIILAALDPHLARAWGAECAPLPGVAIHSGSILDLSVDAIVSPANSFGFMDGGIDLAYVGRFGWEVQDRLQSAIRELHHGELLVGMAEIVETGDEQIPFLVAAPTMRVPQPVVDTVHPYLAARAVFLLWKHGSFRQGIHKGRTVRERIATIAMPGLGTGTGLVSAESCAFQVRTAFEEILLGRTSFPDTWMHAAVQHARLRGAPLIVGEDVDGAD